MATSVLSKASSAVSACARRVSRAARRLVRARRRGLRQDRRQLMPAGGDHQEPCANDVDEGEAEAGEGLWQREILMGARCKPLDFSGVIHYDSSGKRLSRPPPRCGGEAVLRCGSTDDVDETAVVVVPRKAVPKRA